MNLQRINRVTLNLVTIGTSLILTGCGLHLRSPADFPSSLKVLYFNTDNVFDSVTAEVTRELKAQGVRLTRTALDAPYSLILSNTHTSVDLPMAFNSTTATSYTYHMQVNLKLESKNHHSIYNSTIKVSENVVHNVNQISTPVITPLMRRTLTRDLTNEIFDIISSKRIQYKIHAIKQIQKRR